MSGGGQEAWRYADSLFTFSSDITRQEREDISDLLLYADQRASQYYNRSVLWKSWLDQHRHWMLANGCLEAGVIVMQPQVINRVSDLDHVRFAVSGGQATQALSRLATRALRAMDVAGVVRRFLAAGEPQSFKRAWQLQPCERDTAGEITILACGLQVVGYVERRDHEFWNQTSREMVLRINGSAFTFSSMRYAPFRERIATRLSQSASRELERLVI